MTAGRGAPAYRIDNRDLVVGPLPKAAPPVLGDWAATEPDTPPQAGGIYR
jgi:hypothetical protein